MSDVAGKTRHALGDKFRICFHGTRGSLPCPGKEFTGAGGNTSCIEINCADRMLVIDAGSGIKNLGQQMIASMRSYHLDLLLTHAHYDHVEGFPFFKPLYDENTTITLWSGPLEDCRAETLLGRLMQRPFFPIGPKAVNAKMIYHNFEPNQELDLGDGIIVRTAPLAHPGGATGYRIEFGGRSFACITDTEHQPGHSDENVMRLIRDCDLFVYDANFIDLELPRFVGFGHSTWEEMARLHEKSGAKRALATHHSLFRTDAELNAIERRMQKKYPALGAAREGMAILL